MTATVNGKFRFTAYEFLGESFIDVSNDNHVYTARSENFSIEVRDPAGNYERTIYYPLSGRKFILEELINSVEENYGEDVADYRISVLENTSRESLPDRWPVLKSMMVDDENRIWVSIDADNQDGSEYWILENSGELLAKFQLPKNESLEAVKKGVVYTRELDEETALERIVRYRMELIPV